MEDTTSRLRFLFTRGTRIYSCMDMAGGVVGNRGIYLNLLLRHMRDRCLRRRGHNNINNLLPRDHRLHSHSRRDSNNRLHNLLALLNHHPIRNLCLLKHRSLYLPNHKSRLNRLLRNHRYRLLYLHLFLHINTSRNKSPLFNEENLLSVETNVLVLPSPKILNERPLLQS